MVKLEKLVRVTKVNVLHDFWVRIGFTDGSVRDVNLEPFLYGPIFDEIRRDSSIFGTVEVQAGTICWPNGADIDPDVLYYGLTPERLRDEEPTVS